MIAPGAEMIAFTTDAIAPVIKMILPASERVPFITEAIAPVIKMILPASEGVLFITEMILAVIEMILPASEGVLFITEMILAVIEMTLPASGVIAFTAKAIGPGEFRRLRVKNFMTEPCRKAPSAVRYYDISFATLRVPTKPLKAYPLISALCSRLPALP